MLLGRAVLCWGSYQCYERGEGGPGRDITLQSGEAEGEGEGEWSESGEPGSAPDNREE